jgi:hypothetical protein
MSEGALIHDWAVTTRADTRFTRRRAERLRLVARLAPPMLHPDGSLPNTKAVELAAMAGVTPGEIQKTLITLRRLGVLPLVDHDKRQARFDRAEPTVSPTEVATAIAEAQVSRCGRIVCRDLDRLRPIHDPAPREHASESTVADWLADWRDGEPARSYIAECFPPNGHRTLGQEESGAVRVVRLPWRSYQLAYAKNESVDHSTGGGRF